MCITNPMIDNTSPTIIAFSFDFIIRIPATMIPATYETIGNKAKKIPT